MHCQYDQKMREQNAQIEVLYVLQLHQFERLEKGIDCLDFKEFFY